MSRTTRHGAGRRNRVTGAAALAALLFAAGCTSATSGDLLVADVPDQNSTQSGIPIWGVSPGDPLDDDSLLLSNALSPGEITTVLPDGQTWVNTLGRVWGGGSLLSYGDGQQSVVVAGNPGSKLARIAASPDTTTRVLRRGTFVQTADGCVLATSPDDVEEVGEGNCAISLDERWVVSWPTDAPGALTIRDLRKGSTRTIDDLSVVSAAVLSHDNRVMVVDQTDEGAVGVMIDATDGSEVGRTDVYEALQVGLVGVESTGFVALASSASGSELLHIDTEAHVETIDEGYYLVPVLNGHEVTYLDYDQDLTASSIKRWSHDGTEVLLEGYVGAAAIDEHHIIATKETDEAIEFYYQHGGTGELELAYTLPLGEGAESPLSSDGVGIKALRTLVKGSTVLLQINGEGTNSSFVRIDTQGGHSDAPIEDAAGLLLESIDSDGTVLLSLDDRAAEVDPATGMPTAAAPRRMVIVRPHDDEPTTRAVLGRTGTNMIHDGVIYLTDASDAERVVVSTVRATGKDDEQRVLYENKQIAGSTWPEQGGATQSLLITPRLLIEQQQQQLQQQQQMQQQMEALQGQTQPEG